MFRRADKCCLLARCGSRYISTVPAEQPELPYVHLADRVISKGKDCIIRPAISDVHVESASSKKPSFRNISTNYVFDRNIARKISNLIIPHHSSGKTFIEINPGIGCLTAELINSGLKSLHLIEANQSFLEYLQTYQEFSKNVTISNQRFSYFGDAVSMSSLWVNALSPNWSWESNSQASVFGVIPPRQERFLIPWLVNMISSWHDYGRFKYFFVVSDRLLWRCTNAEIATAGNFKHYTVGHILATTLFEMKLLTKVNKSDFVPPISMSHVEQNSRSKKDISKFEASKMALTLIEPRRDLNKLLNLPDCALYAAFVRQLTARRHARLIPTCERLVPGIGLALLDIPDVTSPSTRIGDLRPHSFLEIFQIMKKSPYFVPELFLPTNTRHAYNMNNGQDAFEAEPVPQVATASKKASRQRNPEDAYIIDTSDTSPVQSYEHSHNPQSCASKFNPSSFSVDESDDFDEIEEEDEELYHEYSSANMLL